MQFNIRNHWGKNKFIPCVGEFLYNVVSSGLNNWNRNMWSPNVIQQIRPCAVTFKCDSYRKPKWSFSSNSWITGVNFVNLDLCIANTVAQVWAVGSYLRGRICMNWAVFASKEYFSLYLSHRFVAGTLVWWTGNICGTLLFLEQTLPFNQGSAAEDAGFILWLHGHISLHELTLLPNMSPI